MIDLPDNIWADGPVTAPYNPPKSKVRAFMNWVYTAITANLTNSGLGYGDRAALYADLTKPQNSQAWVLSDANPAYNGIYLKVGTPGTGFWIRFKDLPYSYIRAANTGVGTPNAIQATSSVSIPIANGAALVSLNILAANTGTATVSFNGDAPLTIRHASGAIVGAGGLQPDMIVWGTREGTNFRLVNDPSAANILAQVLVAQAETEAARDATIAALSTVSPNVFATIATAEAYSPAVAPSMIITAFSDTDQIVDSGCRYKKYTGSPQIMGNLRRDGTNIGILTGSGGLTAAFTGVTSKLAVACSSGSGSLARYIGKSFAEPRRVHQVTIHGSSDQGYVDGVNPTVTFSIYGKTGAAPASATDGTLLGTTTFSDSGTTNPQTLATNDRTTKFDHVWAVLSHGSGSQNIFVAECEIYETWIGDIFLTLSDGVTKVAYEARMRKLSATTFGLKTSNTAAQNWYALQRTILRTPTGGRWYIPDLGGTILIDTSGGLRGAVLVSRKMKGEIDGSLKGTYSAYEANPSYMIKITAHGVIITGTGQIEGDGNIIVAPPDGSTSQMPGLIYVEDAKNFRCSGIKILRQPCTGLMLVGSSCLRARIADMEFMGGPETFHFSVLRSDYSTPDPDYIGSAYFGIVTTGGGDHTFRGLDFTKDDVGGGRVINAIFTAGFNGVSNGCKILHCTVYEPWEKLLYGYGDKHILAHCIAYGAYGCADTEAYRFWGSHSTAHSNYSELFRGGFQVLDGAGCKLRGNTFRRLRASGINVQHFSADYTGGLDFTMVVGNRLSRDGGAPERRFGIRVLGNDAVDLYNIDVSGNSVSGFGNGETDFVIQIEATSPRVAYSCIANANTIENYGSGIVLRRSIGGTVKHNLLSVGTDIGIEMIGGTDNDVTDNKGRDAGTYFLSTGSGSNAMTKSRWFRNISSGAVNPAIRNHDSYLLNDNQASGNQFTDVPIQGVFTLATGSDTTDITHGGIAPHATIRLESTSDAYSLKHATDGIRAAPNGTNIRIRNSAGGSASSGSTGRWFADQ